VEKLEEGIRLKDLGVDGILILNKTLNKEDRKA
jgi:alanine racemase